MLVTLGGIVIDVSPDASKALEPMLVRLDWPWKITEVIPVVPMNASWPMFVTLDGIVIEFSPVAPSNALVPMSVTPSGIVMDVKPIASLNALVPMLV